MEEWLKRKMKMKINMKENKETLGWYLEKNMKMFLCSPFFCSGVLHNPYGVHALFSCIFIFFVAFQNVK